MAGATNHATLPPHQFKFKQ